MIRRIDVRMLPQARGSEAAVDPVGEAIRQQIVEFGKAVGPIAASRIFLIDTDANEQQLQRIARELLADPVVESAQVMSEPPRDEGKSRIEIHLEPGVMDPVAASTEMAIRDMGLAVREVRTGRSYVIDGVIEPDELRRIASQILANGVIESIHFDALIPERFEIGRPYQFKLVHVPLRELSDSQLERLSRERHLFMSPGEMRAIATYFRQQGREPTDIELETVAQTWSEHCVHKTLKSPVDVQYCDEKGQPVRREHYENLIRDTIFKSTMQLMAGGSEFCLSVFKDNAGVIAFDETDAVCFKVETHNHPSAIEPYGGAATGVGGVIRDVLGTGLGAKPVANTDVFCVAMATQVSPLPKGVLHPKRVLQQVVAGVRDYGNRMGIPTVNGAVYFDDRYLGNPLVFCGCAGLIPRSRIDKQARAGDAIVLMGGRTGRDGIHGATFSSAELTDTHAAEFSHAVQIGNAITEKKMADVILQARDAALFSAITDCGAGGLSSAVGEMGENIGAEIHLDRVPLKYAGLKYDEIWISEAQERMVLAVPPDKVQRLVELAKSEDVEATVIGTFGTEKRELVLHYDGNEVGRLSMQFLHEGLPMPVRRALVRMNPHPCPLPEYRERGGLRNPADLKQRLLDALSHPNIASKHWIIRQYDHEVQGGSVIKPLTGPLQQGPSDAAVLRPKLTSWKGIALGCGLAPHVDDPYQMALAAIDEAIRNVICVAADPAKIAMLDNFCWPSVGDEKSMGSLVEACRACRDAALAYGIPFVSGKDSLNNQFTDQETGKVLRIPNTLLISTIAVIEDVRKCVTMDLKRLRSRVALVAPNAPGDLLVLAQVPRLMHAAIASGRILSCHDISDGGFAVAAAEMCIASGIGLIVSSEMFMSDAAFQESPGRYLIEIDPGEFDALRTHFAPAATLSEVGLTQHLRKLTVTTEKERVLELSLEDLTSAWLGTLDW